MKLSTTLLLACLLLAAAAPCFAGRPSDDAIQNAWNTGPKLSPFQAVRWRDTTPDVRIDGVWYELTAINDLAAEQIVTFCQSVDKKDWQKRFEEDLPAVLSLMGHEPGEKVQLTVTDLQSAEIKLLPDVAMTEDNRRSIFEVRRAARSLQSSATRPTTQP